MQKFVNLVDLVKGFQTNIYLKKIGFDTAENGPVKACQTVFESKVRIKLEQT